LVGLAGIGAGALGLAAVLFGTTTLLLVLAVVAAAFLLHTITLHLAEVDLFVPFLVALAALVAAWWFFAPADMSPSYVIEYRLPAAVNRAVGRAPGSPHAGGTSAGTQASERGSGRSIPVPGGTTRAATDTAVQPDDHQVVGRVGTRTTLAVSPTALTVGQPVALSVTVTSLSDSQPTGRVVILDGKLPLATRSLQPAGKSARASFSVRSLARGRHELQATYLGSTALAGSSSSRVVIAVR
jgi:hypothetical protein